jgi:hypothetical protein
VLPPVGGLIVGGLFVDEVGDELELGAAAGGLAEFPQLSCGAVVVVDRLIDGVGVELAGAVTVEHVRDVCDERAEAGLVVRRHAFARLRRSALVSMVGDATRGQLRPPTTFAAWRCLQEGRCRLGRCGARRGMRRLASHVWEASVSVGDVLR